MAAITGAVIAGAATLGAAKMQSDAGKDAARAGKDAAALGVAEQRAARDQFQANIKPYTEFGQEGITGLRGLLNDPNSIQDSNAYKFRFDQGLQGKDRSAAARGGLYSGGHSADLLAYGQGMASQEYDNQWGRLMGIANMGQNSAVGAGQMGQNSANAISGLYGNAGNAAGAGAINSANAWSQGLSGLAGIAGNYMGSRQSSYQQPQSQWGAFAPNQSSGGYALGPSNGKSWNFGGG